MAYRLVALVLRQRLADELAGPFVRLVVAQGARESWNDERHVGGCLLVFGEVINGGF